VIQIRAAQVWKDKGNIGVQVESKCSYRVTIDEESDVAHVLAPGMDVEVDLDDEKLPDDPETLAVCLVAMLEGGVEL
jgi:hypothetical protein